MRLRRPWLLASLCLSGLAVAGGSFEHHEAGRFYRALSSDDPQVRHAGRSVVWFDRGTGFLVTADGHVLTSYHVAELEGPVTSVLFPAGRWVELELLDASEALDVALYRRTEPIPTSAWLELRESPVRSGEPIAVIGNPAGMPLRVSFGEVVDTALQRPTHDRPPAIGYSAVAWWGSSGSPVIDERGRAVAIHWGWDKWSGKPFAGVPIARILNGFPALRRLLTDCPAPEDGLQLDIRRQRRGLRAQLDGPEACLARVRGVVWVNDEGLEVPITKPGRGRTFVAGPLPFVARVILDAGEIVPVVRRAPPP